MSCSLSNTAELANVITTASTFRTPQSPTSVTTAFGAVNAKATANVSVWGPGNAVNLAEANNNFVSTGRFYVSRGSAGNGNLAELRLYGGGANNADAQVRVWAWQRISATVRQGLDSPAPGEVVYWEPRLIFDGTVLLCNITVSAANHPLNGLRPVDTLTINSDNHLPPMTVRTSPRVALDEGISIFFDVQGAQVIEVECRCGSATSLLPALREW